MLAPWVWLLPLLPLLAAAGILLRLLSGRGQAGRVATARLTSWSLLLSWLGLVALTVQAFLGEMPGQIKIANWLASGPLRVAISFSLDALALKAASVMTLLVWLAQRQAARAPLDAADFHRVNLGLALFAAGLILTLLAGNAGLAFAGWALSGLAAYLVFAAPYGGQAAPGRHGLGTVVTNRIGDAGFILGIALALAGIGSLEWPKINGDDSLDSGSASLIALGFVLAAWVRSAQLPFSAWPARLPAGPDGAFAQLCGVVLLHTGVFLLLRLEPLLRLAPAMMASLAVLGILTAVLGWQGVRNRGRGGASQMAAATVQVGLMFLSIGLGFFLLATWHLLAHVAWRAYQLSRPSAPGPVQGAAPDAAARLSLPMLADRLLVRPTTALGRDVRHFEDTVLGRLAGVPDPRPSGWASAWRKGRFRRRLALRLLAVEALLAQPRYLLLMVMATLVVIL